MDVSQSEMTPKIGGGVIVSVHVPKTGGKSFGLALEHCFGKRLLRDSRDDRPEGPPIYTWPRRWRTRAWVRSHANELAASYDAIHGHFTASKYFPLLRSGRGVYFCTFLREPSERAISVYFRDSSFRSRSRYATYTTKLLTLSQYASLPKQRRIYGIYTSGMPMEKFAFVGITEEHEASQTLFKAMFGFDFPERNASAKEDVLVPDDLSVRERKAVRASQRANYAIYDDARRRFDALYSQHVR